MPRSISRDGRKGPGTPSASDAPEQQQQKQQQQQQPHIKGRAKSNNPNLHSGRGCRQGGGVAYVLERKNARETEASITAQFEGENGSASNLTAVGASGAETQQSGASVMQQVRLLYLQLRFCCKALPLHLYKCAFAGRSAYICFTHGNCSDICPAAAAAAAPAPAAPAPRAASSQTEAEAS